MWYYIVVVVLMVVVVVVGRVRNRQVYPAIVAWPPSRS